MNLSNWLKKEHSLCVSILVMVVMMEMIEVITQAAIIVVFSVVSGVGLELYKVTLYLFSHLGAEDMWVMSVSTIDTT